MPLVRMKESWPYHDRVFGSGFVYNVSDLVLSKMIAAGVADPAVASDILPPLQVETQPTPKIDTLNELAGALTDETVEAQVSKRTRRGKKK